MSAVWAWMSDPTVVLWVSIIAIALSVLSVAFTITREACRG